MASDKYVSLKKMEAEKKSLEKKIISLKKDIYEELIANKELIAGQFVKFGKRKGILAKWGYILDSVVIRGTEYNPNPVSLNQCEVYYHNGIKVTNTYIHKDKLEVISYEEFEKYVKKSGHNSLWGTLSRIHEDLND